MIVSSGKIFAALAAALMLAGCQSTVAPLNLAAGSSIEAAGFQAVAYPPQFGSPGSALAGAAYQCPAEQCGGRTVVVIASATPASINPNLTVEQAVRSNVLNPAGVRTLLQKALIDKITASNPGVSGSMTSFSIDPKSATQRFTARIVGPDGAPAYMSGFGRFIGNETRFIIAISATPARAARYARPAWLN